MNSARVSVIITTRNESRNIGNCLESLAAQSYPPQLLEIIVVDNQSTDDTKDIAARFTQSVFDKGPERSAQRNYGFSKASGELFMFLDADMILSSTVVERSVELMRREKYCALYIPEIVLGKGFFPTVRRFERSFYDGTVIDCVRIFTREAFEASGGFDESLTGPEDWDFDKLIRNHCRVGVLCQYDFDRVDAYVQALPATRTEMVPRLTGYERLSQDDRPLLFHNEAAFDLWRYLTKKNYYGESFAAYAAKWPSGDPDLARQFGMPYRFFGVFLESGRWRRLLTHPRLTFGMYFLRFLVGFMYILGKLKR
jgi:glycosyltransferase involved in cell wall biosynthesis